MKQSVNGKKKKSWLWPKITDEASALEAAKAGSLGGGLLVAGLALALLMARSSGNVPFGWDDIQSFYIEQTIQIAIALFLTWRVYTGKGRFASIILLIWILSELTFKLVSTHMKMNGGWILMWCFAMLSLVHSARGSWALRRLKKAEAATA